MHHDDKAKADVASGRTPKLSPKERQTFTITPVARRHLVGQRARIDHLGEAGERWSCRHGESRAGAVETDSVENRHQELKLELRKSGGVPVLNS